MIMISVLKYFCLRWGGEALDFDGDGSKQGSLI